MQGSRLYVGGLSYSVTIEDLIELFSDYGQVKHVRIIEDRDFAFVEMSTQSEAEKAKEALNNCEFKECRLKVNEAHPPKKRQTSGYRIY